mgnify:CR=1 FL=1
MLMLPEFFDQRVIEFSYHVTTTKSRYQLIVGRDLLQELGISLDFKRQVMQWEDAEVPMKDVDCTLQTTFFIKESAAVQEATERITRILDAKYQPANLEEVVQKSTHLSESQQEGLLKLLKKYSSLFDGTLGKWKGEPYHIELKEGSTAYHARA